MAHLERQLGLLGLTATGICAMMGASINVMPFMIHRSVPGIGDYVLGAFAFAAALLAGLQRHVLGATGGLLAGRARGESGVGLRNHGHAR